MNLLVLAVVCFGMIGPVLGLGILIPNTGVFLANLFGAVMGERAFSKFKKEPSGTELINPNDLKELQ